MNRNEALEIFEGPMLSDGTITGRQKSPQFQMSLSGKEHIDWLFRVSEALVTIDVHVGAVKTLVRSRWGKRYDYCYLQSGSNLFIKERAKRWYSCDDRKEVPEDLRLTPIMLANWFMGDGTSSRPLRNPGTVFAVLCTENYSVPSIKLLEDQLKGMGISTGRHCGIRGNAGIAISVLQDSVDAFMSIIEPHILPSYRYKIKFKVKTKLEV